MRRMYWDRGLPTNSQSLQWGGHGPCMTLGQYKSVVMQVHHDRLKPNHRTNSSWQSPSGDPYPSPSLSPHLQVYKGVRTVRWRATCLSDREHHRVRGAAPDHGDSAGAGDGEGGEVRRYLPAAPPTAGRGAGPQQRGGAAHPASLQPQETAAAHPDCPQEDERSRDRTHRQQNDRRRVSVDAWMACVMQGFVFDYVSAFILFRGHTLPFSGCGQCRKPPWFIYDVVSNP